jgi:4'-phosphopantetheinyl transferase
MPLITIDTPAPDRWLAVWQLADTDAWADLLAGLALSPDDQQQWEQLRHPTRQQTFLAARHACQAICEMLGISYGGIVKSPTQQPSLLGQPHLQISLSHHDGLAVCALSFVGAIGVDLERPRPQLQRIQHKFVSPQEQAYAAQNLDTLTLCWTAKEALYKCYGKKALAFATQLHIPYFAIDARTQQGTHHILLRQKEETQLYQWQYFRLVDSWVSLVY